MPLNSNTAPALLFLDMRTAANKLVERAIDQGKCAEHDGHGHKAGVASERKGLQNQCNIPRNAKSTNFGSVNTVHWWGHPH